VQHKTSRGAVKRREDKSECTLFSRGSQRDGAASLCRSVFRRPACIRWRTSHLPVPHSLPTI